MKNSWHVADFHFKSNVVDNCDEFCSFCWVQRLTLRAESAHSWRPSIQWVVIYVVVKFVFSGETVTLFYDDRCEVSIFLVTFWFGTNHFFRAFPSGQATLFLKFIKKNFSLIQFWANKKYSDLFSIFASGFHAALDSWTENISAYSYGKIMNISVVNVLMRI